MRLTKASGSGKDRQKGLMGSQNANTSNMQTCRVDRRFGLASNDIPGNFAESHSDHH